VQGQLCLTPAEGRLRARLFDLGRVLDEAWTDDGELVLNVDIRRRDLDRLYEKEGLTAPLQVAAQ